jgi:hypothetical protein
VRAAAGLPAHRPADEEERSDERSTVRRRVDGQGWELRGLDAVATNSRGGARKG